MFAEGGVAHFTSEQLQSAETSYAAWAENKKQPFSFESYVSMSKRASRNGRTELMERYG